jgi:hypothetical protein
MAAILIDRGSSRGDIEEAIRRLHARKAHPASAQEHTDRQATIDELLERWQAARS